MKKIFYSMVLACALFSCKKESNLQKAAVEPETQSSLKKMTSLHLAGDTIFQLDSTKFPKKPKKAAKLLTQDVFSDLYQLNGIDFFIQTKDSYFGKNTFQSQGRGQEVVLAPYNATNNAQLFRLQFLPASSGIPYLIYSSKEQAPIGAGSYASDPNRYVLYTQQSGSTSLFGFSWDFMLNASNDGYYFENQDILGTGPNGPWDIYNYVLDGTNGNISFNKLNNSFAQQFNIIPNDEFTVQSVQVSADGAQITSTTPTVLRSGEFTNNTSGVVTRNLQFNESKTDASSFSETNGITTRKSGQVTVGVSLFKIINIGGNYTFEQGTQESMQYGTNSSRTVSLTEGYTINVPPNTVSTYEFKAMHHTVKLPYTATMQGVNTQKIINAGGVYSGVEYSTTSLVVSEHPVGARSAAPTRTYVVYPTKE